MKIDTAKALHIAKNSSAPFEAVNCATNPGALWEAEVFGYQRGAFTDAKSSRRGLVEQAGDGTLFFDEIGQMPLEMQARMLRLMEEQVFRPLGWGRNRRTRCRFLFATNRDLEREVRRGRFREDLYYRISVFQIGLPPLRRRLEDLPVPMQPDLPGPVNFRGRTDDFKRELILNTLEASKGNKRRAAANLEISPQSLDYQLHALNIKFSMRLQRDLSC